MRKVPVFISQMLHVMKKEIIEIQRSGVGRFLIIAPILQAIIFGFVAVTDITHVKTMICDEDSSALSRSLGEKFYNSEYFKVVNYSRTPEDIKPEFGLNRAKICIRIPEKFSENIKNGKKAQVQLIVDGSDSNSAGISMTRAVLIINGFSSEIFAKKMTQMKNVVGTLPSVVMEDRIWYNPELKSANTMVPGVIAMIVTIVTLVITALSLVREKESGNIEQMLVTPVKPWQIIAGKIIPYIFLALVDIILIIIVSLIVFRIDFACNYFLLLGLSLIMIITNLGIGILISTISATQQQAMLTSIFFMMPNILLSGFIFPIKNMPLVLQWLTYLIPMRYYLVIVRGIFLKGLGFMELLPQTAALVIYGVIVFTIAVREFKKTVG